MTAPEQVLEHQGTDSAARETSPVLLGVLRRRAEFLRAARARRQGTPAFLLQARKRDPDESGPLAIRVGFTCSRKIGNSVTRNRAKRRLREIARAVLPAHGQPGWDYVLVGRPHATIEREYALLLADLRAALAHVHRPEKSQP